MPTLDAFRTFDAQHGLVVNVTLLALAVVLILLNSVVALPASLLALKDLAIAALFAYLIAREYVEKKSPS
jgi:hypothetical protein